MSLKLEELAEVEIEVDVERLDSRADEDLLATASVLREILQSDVEVDDDKGHTCRYCGKLYKTASTLQTHSRMKHPENEVEVRCTVCDKEYASLLSLQKHVRYMHRNQYRCKACYRTFETANELAGHAAACVRNDRPCPTCGKVFDSQLSLRNHVKYKHPEVRTNWCGICRRAFTSGRSLSNHVSAIHPAGTACSQCDRSFNSVPALQNHILYKHSENGIKCSMRRKVFPSRRNLTRHMARSHKEAGSRYCCGVCDAKFQGSHDLIQHVMKLHTGLKQTEDD